MVCPKRVLFNLYIHLLCIECKETVNNRRNFIHRCIHRCIYYEYNMMAIILSRSLYNRDLFSVCNLIFDSSLTNDDWVDVVRCFKSSLIRCVNSLVDCKPKRSLISVNAH
jgi:hypothetical protein